MSSKSARFVPSVRLAQYDVVNTKGDNMGQVQTFVVDMREGLIAFALVAFGGFLGLTDKWFALPWAALKWHPETMKFVLDMPETVLKDAPGMDKDKWLEEIDRWQAETDLQLLDRYYTSHGYQSYAGIVQKRITSIGSHKPDAKFDSLVKTPFGGVLATPTATVCGAWVPVPTVGSVLARGRKD